jgi:hypothetical protein
MADSATVAAAVGLVIVVKGSVTLWLLGSLSTVNFVLIKRSAIISLTLLAASVKRR